MFTVFDEEFQVVIEFFFLKLMESDLIGTSTCHIEKIDVDNYI